MDTKLLKQKILDLAIRGKLVPQDPNDEPASVLLEKIKKEKQELIKQGKIKKDKNESIIFVGDDKQHYEKFANGTIKNIEEIPFEIPENWCWCRLKDLVEVCSSRRILQSDWKNFGIPFYRAREIVKLSNSGFVNNDLYIDKSKYYDIVKNSSSTIPNAGDIMISAVGTIGKSYIVKNEDVFYYKDASVLCLKKFSNQNSKFLKIILDSSFLQRQMIKKSNGTTVDTITIDSSKYYLLCVPPLAEQQRIATKIEELFAQVDKIEEEKQSLLKLIDKTKGKVLDLAMKGKLVEQDPNDDPASVLLEKIFEEKQKLAKEGKIKLSKDELLPPKISDDNDYYKDLPNNWKLTLLKTICEISTGNSINAHIKSEKYTKNTKGLPYIGTKDISYSNRIDYNNGIIIPFNEINNFRVAKSGSTLLCIEGGSCGRKFGLTNQNVCYGNKLCAFKSKIFDKFLYYYIQSNQFLNIFKSKLTGIIGGVNIYKIKEIYIPVPPINEQKRIVVKIENIFTKLEEIKDSL